MEKIWLESYEKGVSAEIDITQYNSVSDVFRQSVEKFARLPAFQNMGKTLTYAETGKLATDFASYLQNVLKLPRGERVAIMMPNVLQYPIALFGILQAGLVAVNTNPLYTPRELEHQLKDSGCDRHHRFGKFRQHAGAGAAAHADQTRHRRLRRRNVRAA